MMKQNEAVILAITTHFGDDFENGQEFTDDDKSKIVGLLMKSYEEGEWAIKSAKAKENVKQYIGGLLNNSITKDKKVNGGEKYEPKNKGSRTGTTNPEVKNLRILRKRFADGSPEAVKIDAKIALILDTIKAEKAAKEIDASVLDPEFQAMLEVKA